MEKIPAKKNTTQKPTPTPSSPKDIANRKQAEDALQESERKFREIFNKINDAIHLHEIKEDGSTGKFIDVNDVACRMLQYSRDEMHCNPPEGRPAHHRVSGHRRRHPGGSRLAQRQVAGAPARHLAC